MKYTSPNHRESLTATSSIDGENEYVYSTNNALDVNITSSIITSDINLTEVGGAAISLGQKAMANSLPITIASDQSSLTTNTTSVSDLDLGAGTINWESRGGVLAGFGGTTIMADMAAYGDDATNNILATGIRLYNAGDGQYKRLRGSSDGLFIQGSAAANSTVTAQPILIGGSDYGGTPAIQNWKVDSSGIGQVNLTNSTIAVTQSGTWNINNISGTISLPTGAATSALQTTGNTSLSTIATNQTNATQKTQIVDGSGNVIASSGNALNVNANLTTNPLVSSPLVGQTIIAVTGTAVRLNGGTSQALTNGIIISAPSGNVAPISVGTSSVNDTADGTGNGYLLAPGASVSFAVNNTNTVYINGQSGDYISWAGS